MSKTYYMAISYKAKSKTQMGVFCEGNTFLAAKIPFTYDDLMEKIMECVNMNNDGTWCNPIIISISELSEGLYKQLTSRRSEQD